MKTLINFFISKVMIIVILWTFLLIYIPDTTAMDFYVPGDYENIQEAIEVATDGDIIIVDKGTYYENIDFSGKAITLKSTDPNNWDVIAATIIDGNQVDSSVVIFENGEGIHSLLSGFVIQNGKRIGISCRNSSPAITNCTIRNNEGGIGGSSPIITNCIISENTGTGIDCYGKNSSPVITDCIICNNSGDGIHCCGTFSTITSCIITGNSGRGLYCGYSSTISNCMITENFEGGIYCYADYLSGMVASGSPKIGEFTITDLGIALFGSPKISECIITNNSDEYGGGIFCETCSPIITNCIISGNKAEEKGGGIFCLGAFNPYMPPFFFSTRPRIINCTITDNSASSGGGISSILSSPTITNSIIWNNFPDEAYGNKIKITYSNVQRRRRYLGRGNIKGDPLFVDPNAGDYHLQSNSPCIDRGKYGVEMGAYGIYQERRRLFH